MKNIGQMGHLPQIGVKIKNICNHHLGKGCSLLKFGLNHWQLQIRISVLSQIHPVPLPIPSMGRLYIYLHDWLMFMVNVGKYIAYMDCSGSKGFLAEGTWFDKMPCEHLPLSFRPTGDLTSHSCGVRLFVV